MQDIRTTKLVGGFRYEILRQPGRPRSAGHADEPGVLLIQPGNVDGQRAHAAQLRLARRDHAS